MESHKMNTDPVVMVPFVQLIEEYPALYDPCCDGYSDRNYVDAIWSEIAGKIGENVFHCKERWKNIRSSYSRWLRAEMVASTGGRKKKQYYLAKHLTFLDRVRPRNTRESKDSVELDDVGFLVKAELADSDDSFETPEDGQDSSLEVKKEDEELDEESHQEGSCVVSGDEKPSTSLKRRYFEWRGKGEGRKRRRRESGVSERLGKKRRVEDHPSLLFFKSIMADVKRLTSKQTLELKLSILEKLKKFSEENERNGLG